MDSQKNSPNITLFDTTLRDGTQGEGISLSMGDKIRIAKKLDQFGIHYIEGGWPGSNPKDILFFEECQKCQFNNATITAFGSTRKKGIKASEDPQVQTLVKANTKAITFFGKSWKLHVTDILGATLEENLNMILDTTSFIKSEGREIIYDAEHFFDGYKDDRDYALKTLEMAKKGGAKYLVLCDTNGGTLPWEVEKICSDVIANLGDMIGIHPHNDCGVGVANAISAIKAGAKQVQGTINGYGERTGNGNLTTIIPVLQAKMGLQLVPHLKELKSLSQFVDELANIPPYIRAPFVGSTAFSHKGGVHVHAVQKIQEAYEHIAPEIVGNSQQILISELSGQVNILLKANDLGIKLEKGSDKTKHILSKIKTLENEGYTFEGADASFELLIRREKENYSPFFIVREFHCTHRYLKKEDIKTCEATVKLIVDDIEYYTVAEGNGPVNALDFAVRKALKEKYPDIVSKLKLIDYKVRILDGNQGTRAKTRVLIDSTNGKENWTTVGISANIIDASWWALLDSYEYFLLKENVLNY